MNKIEYGDSCFGSFVIVDDENLHLHEYDNRNEEYVNELKLKLVNELLPIAKFLSINDLKTIAEIVTQYDNDWVLDEESSDTSTCDQCGNYNYTEVFRKKDNE